MNECGCDNDTGAEIASEEVDIERDVKAWYSFGYDWKKCDDGRDDADNKDGGDSSTHVAIVFVFGCVDEADDIARIGGCNIVRLGCECCG